MEAGFALRSRAGKDPHSLRRVLVGWEMGAGGGHLARLVPIIEALLGDDWCVVAAVRDVQAGRRSFARFTTASQQGRFAIAQAPIFTHRPRGSRSVASISDLLSAVGMDDVSYVHPVVDLWEQLIRKANPSVILSDTAPCLHLAAKGRVPIVCIGNGWTVPPVGADDFPQCVAAEPQLQKVGTRLLDSLAEIRPDQTWIDAPSLLLRGDYNLIFTLPEFDPYYVGRRDPYYWPPEIGSMTSRARDRSGPGVIYLPGLDILAAAVGRAVEGRNSEFVGYFGNSLPKWSRSNLRVSPKPLILGEVLPAAPVIIHHGGLGTTIWAAQLRVPQLALFTDLEKRITASAMANAGYGVSISASQAKHSVADALTRALLCHPPALDVSKLKTNRPQDSLRVITSVLASYA